MESSLTHNLLGAQSMCKRKYDEKQSIHLQVSYGWVSNKRPTKDTILKRPLRAKGPTKWCVCDMTERFYKTNPRMSFEHPHSL